MSAASASDEAGPSASSAEAPEEDSLNVVDLPYECLVEIFLYLDAKELAVVSLACAALRDVAQADCLWRELCVRGQHGASLDFKEMLGTFSHPDARRRRIDDPEEAEAPVVRRSSSSASSTGTPWRQVYFRSLDTLATTVCIDTGRGYAKYGVADSTPAIIQICQPNAEASQETLAREVFLRLQLRRSDLPKCAGRPASVLARLPSLALSLIHI